MLARPHICTHCLSRRTPLDDAIIGKYWMCAKLLSCFGAEHTVPISPDDQEAMDKTSMNAIREVVRNERVSQSTVLLSIDSFLNLKLTEFLSVLCSLSSNNKRSVRIRRNI